MKTKPQRALIVLAFLLIYARYIYRYGVNLDYTSAIDLPSFYYAAHYAFVQHLSPFGLGAFDALNIPIYPFLYPPTSLLFLSPLALCGSLQCGHVLLLVASHAAILLIGWLITRILDIDLTRPQNAVLALFGMIYLFSFNPLITTLLKGQVDLFVLLFLCLFWWALKREAHPALVAVPLAAAIALKLYPGLFVLLLLIKKRYREVFWTAGFLAGLCVLSLIALPPALWGDWITKVVPDGGYGRLIVGSVWPGYQANQSINGFTSRLFLESAFTHPLIPSPVAGRIVPYVLAIIVLGVTLAVCYRAARHHANHLLDLEVGLFIATMVLVGPISWVTHLSYLLPSIFVLLLGNAFAEGKWWLKGLLMLCALTFGLPLYFPDYTSSALITLAMSIPFYTLVAYWLVQAFLIYRGTGDSPSVEIPELAAAG